MTQDLAAVDIETIRQIVREEIQAALKKDPAARKACFIASKGTLDWAYPPLILVNRRRCRQHGRHDFLHLLWAEHRPEGFREEAAGVACRAIRPCRCRSRCRIS